ncbi:MAG: helix-turn-helix domain-containing protein [Ruminococcus sp.]|nr:helix-turn-helix domain-containing protein [Ruminococcus sp.]
MAVYKTKLSGNFTMIPNDLIRNKELSWKEKGVLFTMLSLSAECETTKKTVMAMCGLKRDAATNALNALEKAGYCRKRDDRKKGRFSCEYDFYNVPTFESVKKDPVSLSVSDEPETVQPCREKPSRSTIYKKDKAIKKEAVKTEAEKAVPARLPHGKYQNVFLTDDEYKTLVETYGKEQTDYSIDTLSDFKKKSGRCKNMNDFRQLMDKWIKQDIEWGKTPQVPAIYRQNDYRKKESAPALPVHEKTRETTNKLRERMRRFSCEGRTEL